MFDKLTRPPLFSDADFFVHVDSDCVFKRQPVVATGKEEERKKKQLYRKISRLDFVDARGRVRVRRVAFASLPKPFHRWQQAAEGMLLEKVPFETMSCFPLVFPREVYGLVEGIVLERHGGGEASTKREGEERGEGASPSLLQLLEHHLDDFGEFTAMGHALTTRMEEGKRWVSDSGSEGVGVGDGGSDGGKEGEPLKEETKEALLLLSTIKSPAPKSFCSLTQQAWSWGSVTPEAAVEAERSLRVGW